VALSPLLSDTSVTQHSFLFDPHCRFFPCFHAVLRFWTAAL
jgi:hypothetical protein